MSTTLERIKSEIRGLASEEIETLLRDLQAEYVMPWPRDEEGAYVEAAWDAEIARREEEIVDGRVEPISSAESNRGLDALFAKYGVQRLTA